MMLFRLAGIAWILAAILAGLWAGFLVGMSETPPGQALGRLLAVGALVAAGNGIFCLFRPSRRVALWSVASAVVWVAVTVAEPDAITPAFGIDRVIFVWFPAALAALAGLVSFLAWRPRLVSRLAASMTMLSGLAGLVWLLAAIVAGLLAVLFLGMGQWPGERELGLLSAVGALVAVGNGILGLFRPSPRVALWSVVSAVAWVAVTVVFWVAVSVVDDSALKGSHTVGGLFPAVFPVLAGLVSLLTWRNGKNKKIIIGIGIVAVVIAIGLVATAPHETATLFGPAEPAVERSAEPAPEPALEPAPEPS